jgi:acyl-CoA thioesterase-2
LNAAKLNAAKLNAAKLNAEIADLLNLLELEQLEVNLFRGESRDVGSPQVFGGQVLGQALTAASATIEGRVVHSLHAYFLRRGDFNAPIVYQVDRSLDGQSFSNRRVVAIQHGRQIFNMAASFQIPEEGLDHQIDMPAVPQPEELPDASSPPAEMVRHMSERLRQFFAQPRPFMFRPVQHGPAQYGGEPVRQIWFKAVGSLPDDEALHRCLLAYASDFFLLGTSIVPHEPLSWDQLIMASVDHAMWFHRPLRVDDWLLYDMKSPSASGARGFAQAGVFARDGRLVATIAQEGLVRVKRDT